MIDWFDQEKLKDLSVVVIGAGATGNEVLKNLSLLGVGNIHIIDFDRIEEHNLTRTVLFNESDVGRLKAEAAAEACRRIDPGLNVTFEAADFWKALSVGSLRRFAAAFCCVDNFGARIKLNELCQWARVDLYNLAVDSRFAACERYPFSESGRCACYQCNLPASAYARMRERYSCGWLRKRAWQEKKIPTTIITSSIAAAYASSMLLQKDHPGSPRGAVRVYVDTISLQSAMSEIACNDDCLCSSISRDYHYFKVKNRKAEGLGQELELDGDVPLYFSDKVVIDARCAKCGDLKVINGLADDYDDSLAWCDRCNDSSREVRIKDIMTLEEIRDLFGISIVPVKYIYFQHAGSQFLLELEG